MSGSLEGRLLVSRPELHDPNFDGTITLLLEHSSAGAFGLVLNRPLDAPMTDAFSGWEDLVGLPSAIFEGGPVQRNGLVVLGFGAATGPLPLGLTSVDLDAQPEFVRGGGIERVRIFAGYAGWGGGQLEGELAMGAWWVTDACVDDVLTSKPEDLWSTVLWRSGGDLKWFAHFPDDPSLN
ncbi:MAG: YqgE/AlgH family protein [Actinomycetota bacterium]|nr:YqgE/AlgH family protein [Actinomycetota bacterium]